MRDELRIFDQDNCCRFFPVGFGIDCNTPPGFEAPLNELPDDWFRNEIDAHDSDAKWNFNPGMEALFDAIIRRSEIRFFFYDNVSWTKKVPDPSDSSDSS